MGFGCVTIVITSLALLIAKLNALAIIAVRSSNSKFESYGKAMASKPVVFDGFLRTCVRPQEIL